MNPDQTTQTEQTTIYGDYPGDSDYGIDAHQCVSQCIHPCPVCPPGAHDSGRINGIRRWPVIYGRATHGGA